VEERRRADELQAGRELMMDMHARALAAAQDQLERVREAAGGSAPSRRGAAGEEAAGHASGQRCGGSDLVGPRGSRRSAARLDWDDT
jgi:hypothetical protein